MGNKATTPLQALLDASEHTHSVQELTPQTPHSSSETIEIRPTRNNFGTITHQARPTVRELSQSSKSHMSYDQISKHFEQQEEIKSNSNEEKEAMLDEKELNENEQIWNKKQENKNATNASQNRKKFGTLDGVFGRCLLCIWGVIMYLRTAWVVGNAGIWQTIIIIILASSVTFLTAMSFSAICTNGEVKSGGYYFLISRSLGSEFGGVIGILFYLALCFSVSMYLAGFSETIVAQYEETYLVTGSRRWDMVLWMQVTTVLIFCFALRGIGGIVKFDMILLAVLILSIIVYFIGASGHSTQSDSQLQSIGYTGYTLDTFQSNWNAAYLPGETWPSVFSVYFPAVTGEMAGANISGDLRNPSFSIPYGTISAIIVSSIVYVGVALSLGGCMLRSVGESLEHGLYYDSVVMYRIAAWPPFVIVGMLASTLSSAISCFVGAPRIFQKVCEDNLFPKLRYFAKCRKSDNEPVRAYVVTFIISLAANSSGEINILAPLVTNFCLITYAVMNYSTFTWSLTGSPGWRPTFKWYNKWISLFACFECFTLMFLIDWIMALITVVVGLLMYKYLQHIDPKVNWGTAAEAHTYVETCKKLLKYQNKGKSHAKVQRPKFLIFNRSVQHVRQMIQFTNIMNQQFKGMTMIGDILITNMSNDNDKQLDRTDRLITNKYVTRVCNHQYLSTDIPPEIIENSLIQTCIAANMKQGIRTILETAGVGIIKPNVAVFNVLDFSEAEYIDGLQYALFIGMSVVLVAHGSYMDWTIQHDDGVIDIWWLYDDGGLTVLIPYLLKSHALWKNCKLRIMALENLGYAEQSELAALMIKLRITAEVISQPSDIASDRRSTHVTGTDRRSTHVGGADRRSTHVTADKLFEGMTNRLRSSSQFNDNDSQKTLCDEIFTYDDDEFDLLDSKKISDDNLLSKYAKKKLKKYRKLGKLIERSKDSDLCVVTMPFPRAEYTSYEYKKILQSLTPKNMNNLIFIRGNQDQVLTFAL